MKILSQFTEGAEGEVGLAMNKTLNQYLASLYQLNPYRHSGDVELQKH